MATAWLESATGRIEVVVEVTYDVMPGVVCLPHGWAPQEWAPGATTGSNINVLTPASGFLDAGLGISVGAGSNVLTPASGLDPVSGTAVLNAVPVTLAPV